MKRVTPLTLCSLPHATKYDNNQDLLQQMLVLDPSRRATISEARNHPWCRSVVTRSLKHTKAAQYTVSSNPRDDIYREAITRWAHALLKLIFTRREARRANSSATAASTMNYTDSPRRCLPP